MIHQPFTVLYDTNDLPEMLEWEAETNTPVGKRVMKYRLSRAEVSFAPTLALLTAVQAHNASLRDEGLTSHGEEEVPTEMQARADLSALKEAKGRDFTKAYRKAASWLERDIDDALREEIKAALREKEAKRQ